MTVSCNRGRWFDKATERIERANISGVTQRRNPKQMVVDKHRMECSSTTICLIQNDIILVQLFGHSRSTPFSPVIAPPAEWLIVM